MLNKSCLNVIPTTDLSVHQKSRAVATGDERIGLMTFNKKTSRSEKNYFDFVCSDDLSLSISKVII